MASKIITISREYGSGGRLIGKSLADKLNIPFYDKELLTIVAKKSGFNTEFLEKMENNMTNSLLYTLSTGFANGGFLGKNGLSLNDQAFLEQFDVIRQVAKEGPCVIVGRCADYVLANNNNCINIFIHADLNSRIKRIVNEYGVPADEAKNKITKIDKGRANYYNHYTSLKWGDARNYHLSINSAAIGIDGTVELIIKYLDII